LGALDHGLDQKNWGGKKGTGAETIVPSTENANFLGPALAEKRTINEEKCEVDVREYFERAQIRQKDKTATLYLSKPIYARNSGTERRRSAGSLRTGQR